MVVVSVVYARERRLWRCNRVSRVMLGFGFLLLENLMNIISLDLLLRSLYNLYFYPKTKLHDDNMVCVYYVRCLCVFGVPAHWSAERLDNYRKRVE